MHSRSRTKREQFRRIVENYALGGTKRMRVRLITSPDEPSPRRFVVGRELPSSRLYRSGAIPLAPLFFLGGI
jgi:hypothetical protein